MSDQIALEQKLKLILKTRADLLMKLSEGTLLLLPLQYADYLAQIQDKASEAELRTLREIEAEAETLKQSIKELKAKE